MWPYPVASGINELAPANHFYTHGRRFDVQEIALGHKDQPTLNAMDLSQWKFYILRTAVLDSQVPQRKQMSLATLRKLEHEECTFRELRQAIERLAELMPRLSVASSK